MTQITTNFKQANVKAQYQKHYATINHLSENTQEITKPKGHNSTLMVSSLSNNNAILFNSTS